MNNGILEYWNDGKKCYELRVAGFEFKVNKAKLEQQGRAERISGRGDIAKGGIDSWDYQIVAQAPDFVINGSLVIKDAS